MSSAARQRLNRERVLRAAIALADAEGIEALSMRRLAKELGVEAMSLYNHVANKEEIIAGILDAVAGEIELPEGVDWKSALRRNAISVRDVLLQHRWASALWMSRQNSGPARLRFGDWVLRTFREAGFSKELTYDAFHVFEAYVMGYANQQLSFPYKGEEIASIAASFLERLPVDDYPDFAEHVRQHLEPHEGKGGFELGLDLLLDGLERLRDSGEWT